MADNQNVKNRLLEFLKTQNIRKSHFEKQCGFSNGYVNSMVNSISYEKLEVILRNYPSLNKSWLMTGDGTMLKTDATATSIAEVESRAEKSEEIAELKKEIEFLKGIVSTQKATIDRLLSEPQPPQYRKDTEGMILNQEDSLYPNR